MSQLMRYIIELLNELNEFKDTDEFKQFGFGQGGPYHVWLAKLQTLKQKHATPKELRKQDLTISDIEQYALSLTSDTLELPYVEHKLSMISTMYKTK